MSRMITVKRKSGIVGAALAFQVLLDGQMVKKISPGEEITFPVDERQHVLAIQMAFASTNRPASVIIPAGNDGYAYQASLKVKFTRNEVQIVQTGFFPGAPQAEPSRVQTGGSDPNLNDMFHQLFGQQQPIYDNELDPYRAGGNKYYAPTAEQISNNELNLSQLESYMMGRTLAVVLGNTLNVDGPTITQFAREAGTTIGSAKVTYRIYEGHVQYDQTFYLDRNFKQEITTLPNDQSFDWLLSTNEEQRHALAPVHDLNILEATFLTYIAKEFPNVYMKNGVLYSKKP